MSFQIDVLGLPEVEKVFNLLPAKIQRRALKPALKAGAMIFKGSLIANAPHRTGRLAGNFDVKAMRTRKGRVGWNVYPPYKSELGIPDRTKAGGYRGYYPYAIEYGWYPGGKPGSRSKNPGRGKRGARGAAFVPLEAVEFGTKKVPANPFMHRAFSTVEGAVVARVAEELARRVDAIGVEGPDGETADFSDFDLVTA